MVAVTKLRATAPVPQPKTSLPREAPLAMPVQDLKCAPDRMVASPPDKHAWKPRLFVFGGAALIAGLLIYEMYAVLSVARLTPIETAMLVLFAINIIWIALAFMTAVAGTIAIAIRCRLLTVREINGRRPENRTAILIPAYNEDAVRVFAAAGAMAESLADAGEGGAFDLFVLSDTTDPDIWVAEEAAFRALIARTAPRARVYYRRRRKNTERKAGNVADWCQRFGGAYPCFIVLDADSLMDTDTLIRMVLAMEDKPSLGLLQTVPAVVNRNTVFARLQQFSGRVYGPVMSAGLAAWSRGDANYWGHNAILRTEAFAGAAGLPHLRGRAPFGGHILSHDFVEAALIRRAGWSVVLAPALSGTYEESPPSLIDLAARDRRWCQGNLQHSKVLSASGLKWPSRAHMAMGIMGYAASPVWLLFLIAGLLLALQAQFIRPEYFTEEFQLFPAWPSMDSERAIGLFMVTMAILFIPKLLGLGVALSNPAMRHGIGGPVRGTASMIVETALSALLAPVMMAIQSGAVADILMGRDAGWQPQKRGDGTVPLAAIVRRHRGHTLLGIVLGISAWLVSPQVLAWMSPAVAGLILATPLSVLTARRDFGLALRRAGLLSIPEEYNQPGILRRADEVASDLTEIVGGPCEACTRLAADPALLAFHRANLGPHDKIEHRDMAHGAIDEALTLGCARLGSAETLPEAVRFLSPHEKLAVLADPNGLDSLALLPIATAAE